MEFDSDLCRQFILTALEMTSDGKAVGSIWKGNIYSFLLKSFYVMSQENVV